MTKHSSVKWSLVVLFGILFSFISVNGASDDNRQAYIVYMGELPEGDDISISNSHSTMLHQVLGSKGPSSLIHSYKRSFNGFVAMLTEEEKEKLSAKEGVISVFPDENNHLHTTRSWDFMGFPQQVNRTTIESDIIIGVLDTGIWPESDSFSDKGFGPPPAKWKGICQNSTNITCNNKIIGARYYRSSGLFEPEDLVSPRDSDGHGTHVASTAAGGLVTSASLVGFGQGTARGGVPSARIASYKICWETGCSNADILAAFDDAIADGVDIISLSVGGSIPRRYFRDSIAIGSFHAMKNGILTSNSAGNGGPSEATITNFAPWTLSVAASTIDRKFLTKVQLGNNMVYQGVSINTFDPKGNMYPMIYAGNAPNRTGNYTSTSSRRCSRNSLDSNLVKGKIVLCDEIGTGAPLFLAGAAGAVFRDAEDKDVPHLFPLPANHIGDKEGTSIFNYINMTSNPTASILKSDEVKEPLAPFVASFSSRGPNPVSGDILKPDITAPGVSILAAWSPISPVSRVQSDNRRTLYNIISGTSMSCPHATAVAAYIKSFHPTWSPAAIKSAIMTTAFPLNTITSPDAEFGYGSGHIDPLKAADPGLVYDIDATDYVKMLCAEAYNTTMLQIVTGDNSSSCKEVNPQAVRDLNMPSFALSVLPLEPFSGNFTRTLTNVGSPMSTYNLTVSSESEALKIEVEPRSLSFTSLGQKLSYIVKVEGLIGRTRVSGSLVWSDGEHKVRSPIVVYAIYYYNTLL